VREDAGNCRVVLHDAARVCWMEFRRPVEILTATVHQDVIPLLERLEREVERRSLHAAGFVAYEAAPAFDASLSVHPSGDFPLAWFGLFEELVPIELPRPLPSLAWSGSWTPSLSEDAYQRALRTIREHIRRGDTYQVNYSFRLNAVPPVDPWAYFLNMIRAQGPGFGAFIQSGRWTIASASPELFFRLDGERLFCKPMKGTAPRGRYTAEDRQCSAGLQASAKDRAENLMIVDMVRNDMGRIGETGTVLPGSLFDVERYPTLWQMTSTVSCRTRASFPAMFSALFPAASITGAPKVRTMEIIRTLETTPRRIYTGTIGFLSPGRIAQFNVAIRTLLIDGEKETAEYGTGSGIVWDSDEHSEFAECLLKSDIVARSRPPFNLLETLRWTPEEGYVLLDRHVRRLMDSAAYFGWSCDEREVVRVLRECVSRTGDQASMVRLLVMESGAATAEASPLPGVQSYRLCLAREPLHRDDVFLYHKTTHRGVYDRALASAQGYDDVLLWNAEGEITESTRANVALDIGGVLLTPSLECGLLPGVHRADMLERGVLAESVIRREDLSRASHIYLLNSVRGMWEVQVETRT
jgi:para-aminobenzoate synthetase/4-amino-4-deoxychorismate lyase